MAHRIWLAALLAGCSAKTAPVPTAPAPSPGAYTAPILAEQPDEGSDAKIELSCEVLEAEPHQKRTLPVAVGEQFSVHLCASAGTGFEWIESGIDEATLKREVWQYRADETQIIGGSSWRDAAYTVQSEGEIQFTLNYRRQWEETAPTRSIEVTIEAAAR